MNTLDEVNFTSGSGQLEGPHKDRAHQTHVIAAESLAWALMPDHPELYHREIVSAADADALGIRTSSVLWEKIGVGGAVLPHYHDVAEIIHITAGKVKLLCNGEWRSYQAGDTFQVPAGVVHSVMNDDTVPTEQISIFLPVENEVPRNRFFATTLVPVPLPVRQARDAEEGGASRISGGIEAGSSDVGACGAKESE